jgi:Outer membrane protein beta-barrel family/Carboxypeptidase regulatory-like domain/TonB-dependent Receptor Plug Domain
MKHFLIILLIVGIFSSNFLYSQRNAASRGDRSGKKANNVVRGIILDSETGSSIEYATIAAFNIKQDKIIGGTVAKKDGNFEIKGLRVGKYYFQITFIGYEKFKTKEFLIKKDSQISLGEIFLKKSISTSEGVTVLADRAAIDYQIDKKVINVSQHLTSQSGTAVDVLENVPSVEVDIEGNVSLRGSSNFQVLIDGIPSILSPTDALSQISASTIENIEIITNPSAKYDPDGSSGILNIIQKKTRERGLNGTSDFSAGRFDNYSMSGLVNYNTKKLQLLFGADFALRSNPSNSEEIRRTYIENDTIELISSGNSSRERESWGVQTGLQYFFTPKDMLKLNFKYGDRYWSSLSTDDYINHTFGSDIKNNYWATDDRTRGGKAISASSYFDHKFQEKGHVLVSSVSYDLREMDEMSISKTRNLQNKLIDGKKNTEGGPSSKLLFKLDYELPLGEKSKFEAGLQSQFGASEDNTDYYLPSDDINEDNTFELYEEYSYNVKYSRNIQSAYSTFSTYINDFGFKSGLRGEQVYRTVDLLKRDSLYKIDRIDLFPSLHLSYKFSDQREMMASYSRRIERPRSYWLEPFVTRGAEFGRQGNPNLDPEYVSSFELSVLNRFSGGKDYFSLEAFYRNKINKVEHINLFNPEENYVIRKPENVGQDHSYGFELMLSMKMFDIWDAYLFGSIYQYNVFGQYVRGENDILVFDNESQNWNMRFNNTLRLWKDLRFQLNMSYYSPSTTSQGERKSFFRNDIAVRYELMEGNLSAVLQLRDVLGTSIREGFSQTPELYRYNKYLPEYPQVSFSINYRFNNFRPERKRQAEGDDF